MIRNKLSVKSKSAKVVLYVYSIWFSVNLYALSFGLSHPDKSKSYRGRVLHDRFFSNEIGKDNTPLFFPFESNSLGTYDVSEFVAYTIVIPIIVFALYRIYKLTMHNT